MKNEKKLTEKIDVTTDTILTNTRTIILLNALLTILVLISIGLSFYTLNYKKESSNDTEPTEEVQYDVSMFKKVDASKFISIFKDEKKSLIYLGRSTCGYCVKFLPNLQKAQKEYNYKTYYLDITTVDKKDQKKIQELDDFLKTNYGYTPMVLVVKDGKILNKKVDNYNGVGYTEYKTLEKFLKKLDYKK